MLLDLSSAFDTVDHEILLEECSRLGIRNKALDLVRSYLSNRTVQVACKGAISESKPMISGVPQGSILGPTLFSIYLGSLSKLLDELEVKYHMYADDIQIYWEWDGENVELLEKDSHRF